MFAGAGCGGSKESDTAGRSAHKAAPGRLGISGTDVNANFRVVAQQIGRRTPRHGVAVEYFVGHPPAERAGLKDASAHRNSVQDSDIIETLDGRPATATQLEAPLPGKRAGDVVTLRVWPAHGAPHNLRVRLAAVPAPPKGEGGYFPGG